MSPNTRGFSENKEWQFVPRVFFHHMYLTSWRFLRKHNPLLTTCKILCSHVGPGPLLPGRYQTWITQLDTDGEKCVKSSFVVTTCLNAPPDKIIKQLGVRKQFIKEPSNALKNTLNKFSNYRVPLNPILPGIVPIGTQKTPCLWWVNGRFRGLWLLETSYFCEINFSKTPGKIGLTCSCPFISEVSFKRTFCLLQYLCKVNGIVNFAANPFYLCHQNSFLSENSPVSIKASCE